VFDPTANTIAEGMHFAVVGREDTTRIQPGHGARETAGTFMGSEVDDNRLKLRDFWSKGQVDTAQFDQPSV
jgi:hypothetical protein